jgi:hypothetical protein
MKATKNGKGKKATYDFTGLTKGQAQTIFRILGATNQERYGETKLKVADYMDNCYQPYSDIYDAFGKELCAKGDY